MGWSSRSRVHAGVEIGQGLVRREWRLTVLVLVRKTRWERRMVCELPLAVLLVGVVALVDRVLLTPGLAARLRRVSRERRPS